MLVLLRSSAEMTQAAVRTRGCAQAARERGPRTALNACGDACWRNSWSGTQPARRTSQPRLPEIKGSVSRSSMGGRSAGRLRRHREMKARAAGSRSGGYRGSRNKIWWKSASFSSAANGTHPTRHV